MKDKIPAWAKDKRCKTCFWWQNPTQISKTRWYGDCKESPAAGVKKDIDYCGKHKANEST